MEDRLNTAFQAGVLIRYNSANDVKYYAPADASRHMGLNWINGSHYLLNDIVNGYIARKANTPSGYQIAKPPSHTGCVSDFRTAAYHSRGRSHAAPNHSGNVEITITIDAAGRSSSTLI